MVINMDFTFMGLLRHLSILDLVSGARILPKMLSTRVGSRNRYKPDMMKIIACIIILFYF